MKKKWLLSFLTVLLLCGCQTNNSVSDSGVSGLQEKVVFYVVNDVHGTIEADEGSSYMGMSKLKTYINNDSDYSPETAVILAAGDMWQGSGLSNMTNGACMTEVMNEIGFDAMAIGNHEFDWGVNHIIDNKAKADFPFLAYDIYERSNNEPVSWCDPYTIVERGGLNIGIIGEIGQLESSISYSVIKDYYFTPSAEKINKIATELKDEKDCDTVVLLTHNGPQSYYSELENVDIIFGGHTHAFRRDNLNGITYLQAGNNSRGIVKAVYHVAANTYTSAYLKFSETNVKTTSTDVKVDKIIDTYKASIEPILNTVVGTMEGSLVRYSSDAYNNGVQVYGSIGKVIVKAMFDYALTDASVDRSKLVAVHNTGGVRASIIGSDEGITEVTIGDLYTVSPFDNNVAYYTMKGSVLKSVFDYSESYYYFYHEVSSFSDNVDYTVVNINYLYDNPDNPFYSATPQMINGDQIFIRDVVMKYFQNSSPVRAVNFPL